ERLVLVSLDNCEVSHAFVDPVVKGVEEKHQLKRGTLMIVSSHTHSAPVLEQTLISMYQLGEKDLEQIRKYSETLRARLIETIDAALADLKPAGLEHGVGR